MMRYIITIDADNMVELIMLNRDYNEVARLTFETFDKLCHWADTIGINQQLTLANCHIQ